MNREALEELVYESTGRRDKASLTLSALNLAVVEVSKARLWSVLQTEADVTTTANVASVALDSNAERISEIRLIDGLNSVPLCIRPKTWLTQHIPYSGSYSASRPVWGYLEGKTLVLFPIPDAAYTIRYTYYKIHPSLDTNTSELLLDHLSAAVVAWATSWVFKALEKFEESDRWLRLAQSLVSDAKGFDAANSVITYRTTGRDEAVPSSMTPWLDPFAKRDL